MDIYRKVWNTINKNKMTEPGMHIIVAVSGGADSICLLYVLKGLSGSLGISLEAFHLHHGIRGDEADRDAEFVEQICREWEIPVTIRRERVMEYGKENGLSLEEAGRALRYQGLNERIKETERLFEKKAVAALAHHQEDSVETILHNLFRGSGLKGLKGIAPVRSGIIRPLIGIDKKEITEFLASQGIQWCEDSTNGCNTYTRNKIRNQILPAIKREINQEAEAHILQAGRLIAMADNFLEKMAKKLWEEYGEIDDRGEVKFPTEILKKQDEAVRYYLIRVMITWVKGSMKDIAFSHTEAVEQLLWGQTGKSRDIPGGFQAYKEYDRLCIRKKDWEKSADFLFDIGKDWKKSVEIEIFSYKKGIKIMKKQYTKWFDYDKMKNTLCLRFRESGDYITISGGGRKSIKAFMIDEKIPRDIRGKIPMLADGSHIVWIVGYRISEYYKVTENTKVIMQVRFNGGKENGREDTYTVE
ncbi:tRNA lysidine(34) synthetase TilS [Lachnospiraceae bacterium 62-35]